MWLRNSQIRDILENIIKNENNKINFSDIGAYMSNLQGAFSIDGFQD